MIYFCVEFTILLLTGDPWWNHLHR